MMRFWQLALRNLGRNKKRNLATGSAIAFGFAGILLLSAYAYRAANYLRVYTVYVVHTGHLAIFAENGFDKFAFEPAKYSLSPNDQKAIESTLTSIDGIERFEKQIRGQGLVGNGCISFPFVAQGYEPEVDKALREHAQMKEWMPKFRPFLNGQGLWNYPAELGAILLTKGLSRAIGKTRMHDEFPESNAVTLPDCTNPKENAKNDANVQLLSGAWAGSLSAIDGEVVGVFTTGVQESDNSGIATSVTQLQKLFDTDRITQYSVWLKDPSQLAKIENELKQQFSKQNNKFEILRWNESRLSPYYVGTVDFLDTLIFAGGMVLAAIIALSVLNSATMTILERSQEIGMYRSMGFRVSHVRKLYIQESLFLSALSLLAGTVMGVAAIQLINAAEIVYHPPGVSGGMVLMLILPWTQALKAAAIILLLVTIATLFAVSNRLRSRPADLLGGTLR